MSRLAFSALFAGSISLLAASTVQAAIAYNLTELTGIDPRSLALKINNTGQILGGAPASDGSIHLAVYSAGAIADLGFYATPTGFSDNGTVVGLKGIPPSGQVFTGFSYSGTQTDLGAASGYAYTSSAIISPNGAIVLTVYNTSFSNFHVLTYANGQFQDTGIQPATAEAINNNQEIVGQTVGSTGDAFIFANGSFTNLGTLGGTASRAVGVNKSGVVIGNISITSSIQHAFTDTNNQITSISALPGGNSLTANALNDNGDVVGTSTTSTFSHAFIYTNSSTIDLNNLIDPSLHWTLTTATSINNNGQIVGFGTNAAHQTAAFLLTPVPEPTTLALLTFLTLPTLRRHPRNPTKSRARRVPPK